MSSRMTLSDEAGQSDAASSVQHSEVFKSQLEGFKVRYSSACAKARQALWDAFDPEHKCGFKDEDEDEDEDEVRADPPPGIKHIAASEDLWSNTLSDVTVTTLNAPETLLILLHGVSGHQQEIRAIKEDDSLADKSYHAVLQTVAEELSTAAREGYQLALQAYETSKSMELSQEGLTRAEEFWGKCVDSIPSSNQTKDCPCKRGTVFTSRLNARRLFSKDFQDFCRRQGTNAGSTGDEQWPTDFPSCYASKQEAEALEEALFQQC